MEYFLYIIVKIAQLAPLIPVAMGIAKYKSLPKTVKLFFYFMVFSACTEVLATILARLYNNNMPLRYVYTFVEFAAFCYILLPRLTLFANYHKPLFWSLIVLMLGLLFLDVQIHSIYKMNTISLVAECILIVSIGLAYLLQYLRSDSTAKITGDYVFWIGAGATLYFSMAFFLFTTNNILVEINPKLSRLVNGFHGLVDILSYILFAISFWVIPSKKSI